MRYLAVLLGLSFFAVGVHGAEKFPESCSPMGVVQGIAIGSNGSINFRLKGAQSEVFKISLADNDQKNRFLKVLLSSNDTSRKVCLLVENREVIAISYDVVSSRAARRKMKRNSKKASVGFQ